MDFSDNDHKYFTILYVPNVMKRFRKWTKNWETMTLAYKGLNKLNRSLKFKKTYHPFLSRSNILYKINCLDCDVFMWVRPVNNWKIKFSEHRNHINLETTRSSVIMDYRINLSHEFDWDNVEILNNETQYRKRLISEMVYIKSIITQWFLNLQNDTDC